MKIIINTCDRDFRKILIDDKLSENPLQVIMVGLTHLPALQATF